MLECPPPMEVLWLQELPLELPARPPAKPALPG
jgi:hypothetical protein